MKPLDDLIVAAGDDPRTVSLERVVQIVHREAARYAARAMAGVKLGKSERLVTAEEGFAVARDPVTVGDAALTGKTLRAGESAYQSVLAERGFYDQGFARLRIDTNVDLDNGEATGMSLPMPTNKRLSGRPARSQDFAKMLAVDVNFRLGAGEATSMEKVVERITGRDRNGSAVAGITPVVVLPRGRNSHRTIMNMLHAVARDAPSLVAEAKRQGEITRAGGAADPEFYERLLQYRAILSNPAAVKNMLRAALRKK